MPGEQNVIIKINGRTIKTQFSHCQDCKYFSPCYQDGRGPRYIDQDCI